MKKRRLRSLFKTLIISMLFLILTVQIYILKQVMDSNTKTEKTKESVMAYEQSKEEKVEKEVKQSDECKQTNGAKREIVKEEIVTDTENKMQEEEEETTEKQISKEEINETKKEQNDQEETEVIGELESSNIYNMIVNEANASQEFVDEVVNQMLMLPNSIIQHFYENGWVICITNEDLKNKLVSEDDGRAISEVWGIVIRDEHIIYIKNDGFALKNYVTIHEMGHYADFYVYGSSSLTEEFADICKRDKGSLTGECLMDNESEIFAELFKYIALRRDDNKGTEADNYLRRIIEKYN